jgi:hypothetical protein
MNKRTSRPWKGALMQAGEKVTYDEMKWEKSLMMTLL